MSLVFPGSFTLMKVSITQVTNWNRVLNACRMTVHKEPIPSEPSESFIKNLCYAEHSPLRLLEFDVVLHDVPYFVIMHLVRHNQGIEKFVATSREDRTGVPRTERKQTDLVDAQFSLNAQAFINISRKRLCSCADKDTRSLWASVIQELSKIQPILASVCVPECIYRGFCPEIKSCGFASTPSFQIRRSIYTSK